MMIIIIILLKTNATYEYSLLENAPSSSKETNLIIRNLSNVLKDKCSENGESLSIDHM